MNVDAFVTIVFFLLVAPAGAAVALVGPAAAAVSAVCARRPFAPLVRGSLERTCVVAGAAIAVVAAVAPVALVASSVVGRDDFALAIFGFAQAVLCPFVVGAAPWVAGELLSGPSQRPRRSLVAAVGTAWMSALLAAWALAAAAGTPWVLAAAAPIVALCAAGAYLLVRGAPADRRPSPAD